MMGQPNCYQNEQIKTSAPDCDEEGRMLYEQVRAGCSEEWTFESRAEG